MKRKLLGLCILAAFFTVSCEKDIPDAGGSMFSVDGVEYPTLQAAFDAVASTALTSTDEYKKIQLLRDAKGDGASIDANCVFELNLGQYSYTLASGRCISLGNGAGMYLNGKGGKVIAKSDATAIRADGLFLYLQNDASVQGTIETSSETYAADSFAGTISGDVKLSNCLFEIASAGRGIDINTLSVFADEPIGAALVCNQSTGRVKVSRLLSILRYPVWAEKEGNVSMPKGMMPHVHSFGETQHHSATCCSEDYDERVCSVCGYDEVRYTHRESMAASPCPAKDLVHKAAVPDFPPYGGQVEHWQCPHCLKCYSDAEGKNLINPLDLPLNFEFGDKLLFACDDVCDWHEGVEQTKVVGTVLSCIGIALTLFDMGSSKLSGAQLQRKLDDIDRELSRVNLTLTAVNNKMNEIGEKVDIVLAHLEKIESQLSEIERKLDAAEYKKVADSFNTRRSKLNFYYKQTLPYFNSLKKCEGDTAKMLQIAKLWAESKVEGTDYLGYTEQLLSEFRDWNSESYVSVLYYLANSAYVWEHESYNFIYQAVCEYVNALVPGVVLSFMYYALNPDFEIVSEMKCDDLKNRYEYLVATAEAVPEVCNERGAKLRRFNLFKTGNTFYRTLYTVNLQTSFFDWFIDHTDRVVFANDNSGGKVQNSYNDLMSFTNLLFISFITNDEVKAIYDYYEGKRRETPCRSVFMDEDYAGFTTDIAPYILFGSSDAGFQSNGNLRSCGIMTWHSNSTADRTSSIGVGTVFGPEEYSGKDLYSCKMTEYLYRSIKFDNTGTVQSLGRYEPLYSSYWATIRRERDDEGFMAGLEKKLSQYN